MKFNPSLLAVCIIVLCFSTSIAQNTYVPDDNFEQALIDLGYDSGALNDSVPTDSINTVLELNLSGKSITNISGIEAFAALEELNISNNQIASIDLSYFGNLVTFSCYNNQLTQLNFSANAIIETINCSNNQITGLNLSANPALKYINCSSNQLTSLNLKNGNNGLMTGYYYLDTGIDTRYNEKLYCIEVDDAETSKTFATWFEDAWSEYTADCSSYKVEMTYVPDDNFEQHLIDRGYDPGTLNDSVPTHSISNITSLSINYAGIKNLTGIEKFVSIESLYCYGNSLTTLNLTNCPKLKKLDCGYNSITSLDFSNNMLLTKVYCFSNKLVNLDLSNNPFLDKLYCYNNNLTGLSVRNGNNLNLTLDARNNDDLLCIEVDDINIAESKSWSKNKYTGYAEDCSSHKPEMTYVPDDNFEQALIDLGYDYGELNDSVPTIGLKEVNELYLYTKSIKDLRGIEACTKLQTLWCQNNQISILNLSNNTNLKSLECYNNEIVDLNLSENTQLTNLNAYGNQLTNLNLKNGNNHNMEVDLKNNPDLLCIEVDDPDDAYQFTDWQKNAYAAYSDDCTNYKMEMRYVPDDKFEQALINQDIDPGPLNDSVPLAALKSLHKLNIGSKNIADLTGIEHCINLKHLECYNNQISELDLSNNLKLETLDCEINKITKLVIIDNLDLKTLLCGYNQLIDLDLSRYTSLSELHVHNNKLTSLNLKNGNNANMKVYAGQNLDLICIEVDNPEEVNSLKTWYKSLYTAYVEDCSNYKMNMIYVPDDNFENALIEWHVDPGPLNDSVPMIALKGLTSLNINYKNIKDLTGLETCENLEVLNCSGNQFQNLDLSKNPKLKRLDCSLNQISELHLNNNLMLEVLNCRRCNLINVDLSANTSLSYLDARFNKLTSLNLKNGNNSNMEIYADSNPDLLCIEVDTPEEAYKMSSWHKNGYTAYVEDCSLFKPRMTYVPDDNFEQELIFWGYDYGKLNDSVPTHAIKYLKSFEIRNKNIADLTGIEDFFYLEHLDCANNKLEELNLYANTNLIRLFCSNNKIQKLNFGSNTKLEWLYCNKNEIPELNIDALTNLNSILCSDNQISDLNLSSNTQLIYLSCTNNRIKKLDLRTTPNLSSLYAKNNQLVYTDLRNCKDVYLKIDLTENLHLLCINVDNPETAYENNNWIKDKHTIYSKDCSKYVIPMTYIPDNNFEQALIDLGYDSGELNDSVPTVIIETVTSLDIKERNITDLTGIEDFIVLEYLDCSSNQLSELYLSANSVLKALKCQNNDIVDLDLSSHSNLINLDASNNQLSGLNLKNWNNHNLSIDIRNNFNLLCVQVDDATLSENYTSWYKDIHTSYFEDCSNYVVYKTYIPDNNFEQALIDKGFDSGELNDSVYTAHIVNIKTLNLNDLNIKSLEGIEAFKSLTTLNCWNNQISVLDLSSNVDLTDLDCSLNKLSNLDITSNINITNLNCSANQLKELDLKNTIKIHTLYCGSNQLQNLNLASLSNLKFLYCPDNLFKYLNISSNDKLLSLHCSDNQLIALDVSLNKELASLLCYSNFINKLDLKSNSQLLELHCGTNNLTNLDLSQNRKLHRLYCYGNELTELNIRNGNNSELGLNEMYAYGNRNLTCIQVDNKEATLTYADWKIDAQTSYSENCGNVELDVPEEEYTALINLYISTNGSNWTNNTNWLDPTAAVANWYGVTVKNGHVTEINLNNNNLEESAFSQLAWLPYLRKLDLGNNLLDGFNFAAIDSCFNINYLDLSNNKLVFEDIIQGLNSFQYEQFADSFYYHNQQTIGYPEDVSIKIGANFSFNVDHDFISDSDKIQWLKEGVKLEGKSDERLTFSSVSRADSGSYYYELTNSIVPGLSLRSHYKTLNPYSIVAEGAGIPQSEYNALVDFYNNLKGDYWTRNDNWLDTVYHSVGDWYGITVESGHVTRIVFGPYENYNLNGILPNSLGNLSELKELSIVSDNVSGILPDGLFNCSKLEKLNIAECQLSGQISDKIEQLKNLHSLSLEANQLNGAIPNEIGNLPNLGYLALYENNLSGDIPSSLGENTNLEYLNLSYNKLTGTIPNELSNLKQLGWLMLHNNQLNGPVPSSIADLTQMIKFTIENNLIGIVEEEKSASIKSNDDKRKIPDALAQWLELDTFRLSDNNLQFNDIEAIFSWGNFNSINEFIYSPQGKIGIAKQIEKKEGESLSLEIDNYYPGSSDTYQWFKDGSEIDGANAASLQFDNLKNENSGIYYCLVGNNVATGLDLSSREITLNVRKAEKTLIAGVDSSEFKALETLYDQLKYFVWGENWLDTTNSSVGDWEGVTVRNGHVVALDLSGLGIKDDIFDIFSAFDSLNWFDLSNNNLSGVFPSFSGAKSGTRSVKDNAYDLSYLNVSGNRFQFSDLEPVANELSAIDTFIYSPQQNIGSFTDTSIYKNEAHSISIIGYYPGENDEQHWYKNDTILDAFSPFYEIPAAIYPDSGTYSLQVLNPIFSDLVLNSMPYKLSVKIPLSANIIETPEIQLFPNPTENEIFVETYGAVINLSIINVSGEKIVQLHTITSQKIDISNYSKGIYFFRIETGNQIKTQKIIFK